MGKNETVKVKIAWACFAISLIGGVLILAAGLRLFSAASARYARFILSSLIDLKFMSRLGCEECSLSGEIHEKEIKLKHLKKRGKGLRDKSGWRAEVAQQEELIRRLKERYAKY